MLSVYTNIIEDVVDNKDENRTTATDSMNDGQRKVKLGERYCPYKSHIDEMPFKQLPKVEFVCISKGSTFITNEEKVEEHDCQSSEEASLIEFDIVFVGIDVAEEPEEITNQNQEDSFDEQGFLILVL